MAYSGTCAGNGGRSMKIAGGVLSLIVLALDLWAIFNVASSRADTGRKVLWVLLIAVLPVLGLVIWVFAGPRRDGSGWLR